MPRRRGGGGRESPPFSPGRNATETGLPGRRPISFLPRLEITTGAASDWPYFARWHYRGRGIGPVRKVFLLWHGDEPIGICVFTFGPLSSSVRNRLFGLGGKLTSATARLINRNFASVSRLVLDPRYRGASIASAFLRRCCEMSDWPWIELVSEMADLVKFCESAGFRRIGRADIRKPSRTRRTDKTASPWGKSGWNEKGFRDYTRRVRYSRPVYFIFDNRNGD